MMKPVDIKGGIYIDFDIETNNKDSKFKVAGYVRASN